MSHLESHAFHAQTFVHKKNEVTSQWNIDLIQLSTNFSGVAL